MSYPPLECHWGTLRAILTLPPATPFCKPSVSRASKPAGLTNLWRGEAWQRPADLEIGDTAGLETCATGAVRGCARMLLSRGTLLDIGGI